MANENYVIQFKLQTSWVVVLVVESELLVELSKKILLYYIGNHLFINIEEEVELVVVAEVV